MRRSEPLIPLSHDHHHGLVVCRHIREAIARSEDPERISTYVQDFWANDLARHFDEEEQCFFTLLPPDDGLVQQALDEHRQMRKMITQISEAATVETLTEFGKLLEQHIRFEERSLFPHLEQQVPAALLSAAGRQRSA